MYFGIGYDVHCFTKGNSVILGGVKIKHSRRLAGHSDADAVTHALMDALLGAAGLSDIGHFFPNTDPKLKDISSLLLLKRVVSELKKKKLKANNADIMIIAEKPKISPHIKAIKKNFSKILGIPVTRIGVKATTNEGLGFIGRGEGIAAFAVASLRK
ncbi:MAG: 2-C-methyl-D-erythritol 2,4-cyclodiphosphate synthase [Elusimicrobiota bacterium]